MPFCLTAMLMSSFLIRTSTFVLLVCRLLHDHIGMGVDFLDADAHAAPSRQVHDDSTEIAVDLEVSDRTADCIMRAYRRASL